MSEEMMFLRQVSQRVFARRGPAKRGMWMGHRALKFPTDLMLYAEMIYNNKPDFIIETGTRFGGSTLFLAHVCDIVGHGRVISVEIENIYEPPAHDRITYLRGNSLSKEILDQIKDMVGNSHVMITLDSDHSRQHIKRELDAYKVFLQVGDFMIAEDLHDDNARPIIREFIGRNAGKYKLEKGLEKYGIHSGSGGFLKRVR